MSDRPFWLSWWWRDEDGAFELHNPWWVTGERGDGARSVCAAVRAASAEAAMEAIVASYDRRPDGIEFRFCEKRPAGWSPFGERFQKAEWMRWEDEAAAGERAMAALDRLADEWAERIGLLAIVGRIVHDPAAVEALMRQSYIEGACDGLKAQEALAADEESAGAMTASDWPASHGWQPIETAPKGSPILRIDGPLLEVLWTDRGGGTGLAYFGLGADPMIGPRWNDIEGRACAGPTHWRETRR